MEELAIISTILDKATPKLSKFLLVDTSFLEDLVAEEVITSEQKAQIEVIQIKQEKVRKLLTMIENKRSYYGFMRRLNRGTTKELYDFMKDLEKKHGLHGTVQHDNQMSSPSTSANAAAQGSRPFRDQEPATYPPADGSDVMISYQWDSQKRMLQVRDELKKRGLTVWIDVEKMAGNIYDRMAAGVKGAKVVLVCYSKKYEESENCKKEAEFAVQQKKRVIPLKSDDYVPDNWLGLHFGAHLYHKVDTEENLKNNINGLVNEIKGDAPHIPPSQSVSPSSSFKDQGDAPHIPSSQSVSPSSSFKDQEILKSKTDILDVTNVFSNAALEVLCIHLGLDPDIDIANAKQGYPQLSEAQARGLLHLWLNRQVQPPKRSDLIKVMERNDDWKAWVTKLKAKWK